MVSSWFGESPLALPLLKWEKGGEKGGGNYGRRGKGGRKSVDSTRLDDTAAKEGLIGPPSPSKHSLSSS